MATQLEKPVTRVTNATYRDKGKDRVIEVTLSPGGDNAYISMRLKGLRSKDMEVTVDVASLYGGALVKKHLR